MVPPRLVDLERRRHVEDDLAVLTCGHATCHERPTVADVLDVVDDRDARIAAQDEVHVHRVDVPVVGDGVLRGHQGLRGHLTTEDPDQLAALGLRAAEQTLLELLQIEQADDFIE